MATNCLTKAEVEHFRKFNRKWRFKDGKLMEVKDELASQEVQKRTRKLASYPAKASRKGNASEEKGK